METLIWVFAGLCSLGLILSIFFLIPFFFGAPYEPTFGKNLDKILEFTNPQKGDKIAELGSGDGRICIELAKNCPSRKIEIHGYELNPFLVLYSRYRVRKAGLKGVVFIHFKNFFGVNLKDFNKVVLFQFRTIMNKLSTKFRDDLKKGSSIISREWLLPNWEVEKKWRKIYLYKK